MSENIVCKKTLSEYFEDCDKYTDYWLDRGYYVDFFGNNKSAAKVLVNYLDQIVIIELLFTRESDRGRGLGSRLVCEIEKIFVNLEIWVLSLETSAVFWLERGYFQETNPELESIYSDVFVLKKKIRE